MNIENIYTFYKEAQSKTLKGQAPYSMSLHQGANPFLNQNQSNQNASQGPIATQDAGQQNQQPQQQGQAGQSQMQFDMMSQQPSQSRLPNSFGANVPQPNYLNDAYSRSMPMGAPSATMQNPMGMFNNR